MGGSKNILGVIEGWDKAYCFPHSCHHQDSIHQTMSITLYQLGHDFIDKNSEMWKIGNFFGEIVKVEGKCC